MCAEIEQVVTRLIKERLASGSRDEPTKHYLIMSTRRSVIRNAKFSEIRNRVGFFGDAYQGRFNDLVHQSVGEDGIDKLGIAVGRRNEDAHESPPDITFSELEEAYNIANSVVDAVRITLADS